jgi:hypothetical protein
MSGNRHAVTRDAVSGAMDAPAEASLAFRDAPTDIPGSRVNCTGVASFRLEGLKAGNNVMFAGFVDATVTAPGSVTIVIDGTSLTHLPVVAAQGVISSGTGGVTIDMGRIALSGTNDLALIFLASAGGAANTYFTGGYRLA